MLVILWGRGEGVRPNTGQDSFLHFADLPKEEGETHHQFFEQLNSHIRRHLTPANIVAAGMNSGADGDTYNITIGNMVVAHWLQLTDARLIKLVRLEYAAKLKQGTQLVDLLPRIAKNVNTLLVKAEANINTVQGSKMGELVEAQLNRMGFLEAVITLTNPVPIASLVITAKS